ncbi:MAG: hypothetical protein AAFP02_24585 [Bacteroidota bacterium]
MSSPTKGYIPISEIRPRFQVDLPESIDSFTDKLNTALADPETPCLGQITHGYGTLRLPLEVQHYWSPQLSLSLEENEEGGTHIRGLYGPRGSVWTMFVFCYAILGFGIVVISMIGLSNISLDKPAHILWWVPLLILAFLSLYMVADVGKRKGRDQMIVIHRFLEERF